MTHANPQAPQAPQRDHESPGHHEDSGQAKILDLDTAVLGEHTAVITEWLPLQTAPRQIVDIGCGTGAGTFALLDRFPDAHVTAVDASTGHLQLLREKADAQRMGHRVRTVQADLDNADWPDLGTPDLVWASASMHHFSRPDHALRKVRELLAPHGLFAVVELAGLPRFLPEGVPEDLSGLEDRLHQASDRLHAHRTPHRGADWGTLLTEAGFTVVGERTITVNIQAVRDTTVVTYALNVLQRLRHKGADAFAPEDLAALDRLLDTDSPHGIARRDDIALRTERTVWVAHRTPLGNASQPLVSDRSEH